MTPSDPILQTANLCRAFGGIQALRSVHVEVKRGSITGLIGPNGSGKTTFFQVVSGMDRGGTGHVIFNGKSIMGRRPFQIYRMGLARTFQLSRVFPQLTVLENLLVANRRRHADPQAYARELLDKVQLGPYAHVLGRDLSYGQQRLVEFVRVLMNHPVFILLDEPAAGVNPTLRQTLWELVRQLNSLGTTFLIIEHNMHVIADLCNEVYVLNEGEVIAQGPFAAIRENTVVLEAYFGRTRTPPRKSHQERA
jgi:ABC-type branched-subunit amino acid transport system ATPase component